jgi:hypothetical protein
MVCILCHDNSENVSRWLEMYEKYEWNVETRGVFPFELEPWIIYRVDLFDEYVSEVPLLVELTAFPPGCMPRG